MRHFILVLIATASMGFYLPAVAQPVEQSVDVATPRNPLDAEAARMLDDKARELEANVAEIRALDKRLQGPQKTPESELLVARLDRVWVTALRNAVDYASTVTDLHDRNFDVGRHFGLASKYIAEVPTAVRVAIDRRAARLVLPDPSKSAGEQAQIDERFFADYNAIIADLKMLVTSLDLAQRLGINVSAEQEFLRSKLQEAATNASVYLDVAQSEVPGLRAAVAALPDDKELAAELKFAIARVKRSASALESLLAVMSTLNLPTAQFSQQLVTATGMISARALNIDVVSGLLRSSFDNSMDLLLERGPDLVLQLLSFLLIVWVFYKLAGLAQKGLEHAIDRSRAKISILLRHMILSSSRNIVIMLGVLIALAQLGISLGPLLAGLGIAGFIIGFALQDSLANFASGMMILFYRPFDVGDTIEVAGISGKVRAMTLVNTTILTVDNKSMVVPNNKIWQDVITNVTARRSRRIDMEFGIAYNQDIDHVEKLLLEILHADKRVLHDPEPVIKVGSFGESAVKMICRPWVKTDDYWDVMWDINKRVKQAFDRDGISMPFPQRDIHVHPYESRPGSGP